MDIRMPVMDGLEATAAITAANDAVRVLVLTTFDLDEYVFGALKAGASGFLLKDTPPAALLDGIRVVAAGEALLAPSVTRHLIEEFVRRPGYATFIEALGQVYCGHLDRYVALTGEVAALPGPGRAYGIAAYVDGLQSAGRVEEALALVPSALAAASELGNPYWVAYTRWIVGLAWSKADPARALETWDEGIAYLEEHDVRFFEGFMARDAALLHTSDGQLETALALFDTSIGTFLRAGAVSQLTITLASLPALFERVGRPAAAGTLLGAMLQHPGSLHHVPSLSNSTSGCGRTTATRSWTGGPPPVRRSTSPRPRRTPCTRSRSPCRPSGSATVWPASRRARRRCWSSLAEGSTTRAISERLFISAKTADNHIQHIYTKLGVTNRAAATRWALEHGIGEPVAG